MESLKFYVVTDTHYYDPSLGDSGTIYTQYMRREQMCLKENKSICENTFDAIIADKDTNIVILPGDLCKDGDKVSHLGLIECLKKVKASGKRVLCITAPHDYNSNPRCYGGEEFRTLEGTERDELYDMYYEFGFSDALSVHRASMSYTTDLGENIRLLALNCDGTDGKKKGTYDDDQKIWIDEQLKKAKEDGVRLIAMNHYPFIPPLSIFSLVNDAKMHDWQDNAAYFADNGLHLIFTGHMHIQSVNDFVSPNGNRLIDVCTSALVGSPGKYRRVEITPDDEIKIETLSVPEFERDRYDITTQEYFDNQFRYSLENKISDALTKGEKLKTLKKIGGKIINSITIGGLGRLLFIHVKKPLAKQKLLDFVLDLVIAVFAGDPPYTEDTYEYSIIIKVLDRLKPVLKIVDNKLGNKLPEGGVRNLVITLINKECKIPDNDCEFQIALR